MSCVMRGGGAEGRVWARTTPFLTKARRNGKNPQRGEGAVVVGFLEAWPLPALSAATAGDCRVARALGCSPPLFVGVGGRTAGWARVRETGLSLGAWFQDFSFFSRPSRAMFARRLTSRSAARLPVYPTQGWFPQVLPLAPLLAQVVAPLVALVSVPVLFLVCLFGYVKIWSLGGAFFGGLPPFH